MEITSENLPYHELIGLMVEVSSSSSRYIVGLKGRVVDETLNMIIIETDDGTEKKIPKSHSAFIFTIPNGEKVEVEGGNILSRPEDRIQNRFRR